MDLLSKMDKMAVDMPTKQQTEQDLSKMALTFLKDRAPQLLPNLIGFELVDNNEDMTRVVAMFGLEVGDEFYYIPVFFVNSQIRGMVSLYSKQDDTFIPLQDKWVNYILDRNTIKIGKKAPMDNTRKYDTPDFSRVSRPPAGRGTKMASAWHDICSSVTDSLAVDPALQAGFSGAVKSLQGEVVKTASSDLLGYMHIVGPKFRDKVLAHLHTPEFCKAAMSFYTPEDLTVVAFDTYRPAVKQASTLKVITKVNDWEYSDCTDRERHRMVADGFTIKDRREEEDKSEVFKYNPESQISTPDEPGLYKVLLTGGVVSPSYVFMPSFDQADFVVVYDPGTGRAFTADSHRVFCVAADTEAKKEENDPYKDYAVALTSIIPHKVYIFITKSGTTTPPFQVESLIERDGNLVVIRGEYRKQVMYDSNYKSNSNPETEYNDLHRHHNINNDKLILSSTQSFKRTAGAVMIPDDCKAIEVCIKSTDILYTPATMAEGIEELEKDATVLTVSGESNYCRDPQSQRYNARLDGREVANSVTYKQACETLVLGCGLSVEDTEDILREATKNAATQHQTRRLFKQAQVNMPAAPAAPAGYDAQIGIPVEYPQEEFIQGTTQGMATPQDTSVGSGANVNDPTTAEVGPGGGGASIEERTTQLAQQAAETGQQQVFDHAAIGGLSVLSDISSVIDTAIPDFMKSLDRIGRILFLFYWNNSEFSARYGTQDIAGLEDSLKGVYKNFGNLVLQLKEKVIDANDRT